MSEGTSPPDAPSMADLLAMITALCSDLSVANTAIDASNAATISPSITDIITAIQSNKPKVLTPMRGGIHQSTGQPYVGGAPIGDDYQMKLTQLQTKGYRGPGQFRTGKQVSINRQYGYCYRQYFCHFSQV